MLVIFSQSTHAVSGAPVSGSKCKKIGKTQVFNGDSFTCKLKGKNRIWIKTKKQQLDLVKAPTGFDNLYENRKGISRTAWQRVRTNITTSISKVGQLEILTGPNTIPFFDDYPLVTSLVSRAFPNHLEPEKTLVIRYKYVDLEWAEKIVREKLSNGDYLDLERKENGGLVSSNCDQEKRDCWGAKQQTAFSSRVSIILQGVRNSDDPNDATGKMRFYSGMLEAHEYFHALQRIPIMGKSSLWPHAWYREGSAEWIQNATINYNNFESYQQYMVLDCEHLCLHLKEQDIAEFLQTSRENVILDKFEPWLNYSLGSWVIESLVSLKGPDVMLDMYVDMGKGLTFDQAFSNLFGVEWSYAIPILAKTIYANLNKN